MKRIFRYPLLAVLVGIFTLSGCASSDSSTDVTTGTDLEAEIKEDPSQGSQAPMDPDTDMSLEKEVDPNVSASNPVGREMNIVALVQQNPDLSTFLELVRAADLVTVLESPAPYTVFAPTNEAFAALPAGTLEALKRPGNKLELTKLLQAHVLPNRITANEMQDNMPMKTALGEVVIVKRDGPTITVGGAKVLTADVNASNGVIHVVDKVLVPPQK
ncbi:fasciclin domain-containing protein [Pontibacter sp. MBLB2868]|uniref:fasciclin domain-containing protein n=1 Tax=Pontibacter sp. MBLB2868 TaxID=3451555 RepID=UPI003F755D33